jgi:hypothetical protein
MEGAGGTTMLVQVGANVRVIYACRIETRMSYRVLKADEVEAAESQLVEDDLGTGIMCGLYFDAAGKKWYATFSEIRDIDWAALRRSRLSWGSRWPRSRI